MAIGIHRAATSQKAFAAELFAFSEFVEDEAIEATQKIALFTWKSLVRFTPVLSGRARASWNLSFDSVDVSIPSIGAHPMPPNPPLTGDNAGFKDIFVSSSLNYMPRLEDGYSSKGQKMVEKTMNLLDHVIPTIIGDHHNV